MSVVGEGRGGVEDGVCGGAVVIVMRGVEGVWEVDVWCLWGGF